MRQVTIVIVAPGPRRMMSWVISLAAGLVLAGCAVGPNYRRPEPAPVVAHNVNEEQFTPAAPAKDWWLQVEDPELASLEQRAVAADLDLQVALQRVLAARAVFSGAELDLAPHIPRRVAA